jgi:hypothetical protein
MILQQFLPKRSAEDRIARRVVLILGDETFMLRVLTIEENEGWRAAAAVALTSLISGITALDDADEIFKRFGGDTELQLALIRTYDKDEGLPDDAWVRSHASADDLFQGAIEVAAAAYPPLAAMLDLILRNPAAIGGLVMQIPSSTPTNGQQPSMAGRAKRSGRR